jgi:hypothetical protein
MCGDDIDAGWIPSPPVSPGKGALSLCKDFIQCGTFSGSTKLDAAIFS